MFIQTAAPFSCGGTPIRHWFAMAGVAAMAAPLASMVRRVML
jgi:hypothetical protein